MIALLVGSVLAVGALAYVLGPILSGLRPGALTVRRAVEPSEASALEALREIEFDRATGKLSIEDYDALRARYAPRAVEELRAREAAGAASSTAVTAVAADPAEALIARAKANRGLTCPNCGPRPESDALFCSDCGRYLGSACLKCGAAVENDQARFCGECGEPLAA